MLRFCLVLFNLLIAGSATAVILPSYRDDAEYDHCTQVTGDYEACAREQSQRVLRDVKILYSNLLVHPDITDWNGSPEANKQMLRDLYESWTAYRNRKCSLAVVAATYLPNFIKQDVVCALYENIHTKNHLLHILHQLEPNKYPKEVAELSDYYTFAKVKTHDDSYKSCVADKTQSKENCLKDELKRTSKTVKNYYNSMLNSEFTNKWNNGPDLKKGNYRDMYDSWIAYRNRLCSLNTYVENKVGKRNSSQTECALFLTYEHKDTLENLILAAASFMDEEWLSEIEGDGGEAEGKKITPLKRRISSLSSGENELDEETAKENNDTTKKSKKDSSSSEVNAKGRKIPAWAQKP